MCCRHSWTNSDTLEMYTTHERVTLDSVAVCPLCIDRPVTVHATPLISHSRYKLCGTTDSGFFRSLITLSISRLHISPVPVCHTQTYRNSQHYLLYCQFGAITLFDVTLYYFYLYRRHVNGERTLLMYLNRMSALICRL